MNLDFYFPTPVWWEDTTLNNTEILKLCNQLRTEDPIGRKISNNGGWQSKDFKPTQYNEFNEFDKVVTQI